MSTNQEQMLALLNRAYLEGATDTLNPTKPTTDDGGIPEHDITNPLVKAYLLSIPEGGYAQDDISRTWFFSKYVSGSSKKNMADRGNPYLVFCKGDYLLLESDGEKPQTILPENNVFACYLLMPEKVYHWKVYKSEKVVKEGSFKTVGDIRLIQIPTWPNLRDIAYTPLMKAGLVYSGANPDNVVVGSDDYNTIKYLGIDTQINLRNPSEDSNTEKPWRPDLFTYGYDIMIADYISAFSDASGIKTAFETLVSELEKGRKVAFNCFAGADRTGTFRYLLQGLCGVPRHIAQGYYELTSFMFWENFKRWDKEDKFRAFDKELITRFDGDFQHQCFMFLTKVAKVSTKAVTKFQNILMKAPSSESSNQAST